MATKSMSYDHPAYRAVLGQSHHCIAGANAVSINRFNAYQRAIIKSVTGTVLTAGTSAGAGNGVIVKAVTAAGATTTAIATISLNTLTSGQAVNVVPSATTLAQGEYLTFTNGTDATGVANVAVEYVLNPGADVTE